MKSSLIFVCLLATACGTNSRLVAPNFHPSDAPEAYPFIYPDTAGHAYLRQLRQEYALTEVTAAAKTDLERVLAVLHWTHRQWSHNGSNVPSKSDALTILAEVAEGKRYRCVEYGIVSSEALAAIGVPARVLALKTADVETRKYGAGHVAAEAYLADLGKWVFLDGQFDVVPVLDGVPLNAVEFAQALQSRPDEIVLLTAAGPASRRDRRRYLGFVREYLYYLDVEFDTRPGIAGAERVRVDDRAKLMLVPTGAQEPRVFQRDSPIEVVYTSSPEAFYAAPGALR